VKNILYISYDGMTDPLGQSQVLSYLRLLSQKGYSFTILSYEKPGIFEEHKAEITASLNGYPINWIPMRYTKNPPVISTWGDLLRGKKKIRELFGEKRFDLVHCRGYISALLGLYCKKKYGSAFIFDMRGWWADEKLESGNWNNFLYKGIYRYFKKKEKKFFSISDHAISLTHAGKNYIVKNDLKPADQLSVIPTCVDFGLFKAFDDQVRKEARAELNIHGDAKVLLYSGSMGGNYRNDLIFGIFKTQLKKEPNSRLLLLTATPADAIGQELKKFSVPREAIVIRSCRFTEMSRYLAAGDIGLVFYDQQFSALGRSPTKLGEYWASGLPFISTTGIGDLELLHSSYPASSYLLREFTEAGFMIALDAFKERAPDKLRAIALENFDLKKGAEIYSAAYNTCFAD
jgi:glycosyltransferase involved in cell wall biosynthesis